MHRSLLCIVLAVLAVGTCAADTEPRVSFRLMSYNVGAFAHIPFGQEQVEIIADQIVDNGIDIAGITELDAGSRMHDGRDMVSELAVALAKRGHYMHHYYEPAFQHSGGWAVHALFSRWAIRECGYRAVKGGASNTGRWVMGHIGVDVAKGTRVHVFMTHFWPWVAGCEKEVASLFSYPGEFQGPKLIMGDFNATEGSPTMNVVRNAGFESCSMAVHGRTDLTVGCSAGIAAPLPLDNQIDYIVGNEEVRFTYSYVPYMSMSDHWPIVAVAEVAKGSGPSEWAGDEEERPRNWRFSGGQVKRDRAMGLYREKRYAEAAQAMLELEKNASGTDLKSFYAFSAATMRLLGGDKRGALAGYHRLFDTYPVSKWTAWGHHRAAFAFKDLSLFREAEDQFICYMRDYMTALHLTPTTISAWFAMQQIAFCRQARGIECSNTDVLRELAGRKDAAGRAASYRLSMDAYRAGNDVEAARLHELGGLTAEDAENDYLMCLARGFLELGKRQKADNYIDSFLSRLSPQVARYKRAEWETVSQPGRRWIDVRPVPTSDDGRVVDWDRLPAIGLEGERHLFRVSSDAGDLSASLRLGWTPAGFHVRIDVRNTQHHCLFPPETMWNGDSVQVAIDPEMNGGWAYDPKDLELGVALGDSGVVTHVFHGRAGGCRAWVSRQRGSVTSYEVMVPWSDLGLEGRDGTQFAFDILANDSDGAGRAAWVDLTPGIGEIKAPILYRKLRLVK